VINALQNLRPVRLARQLALGIDARRRLPELARETFRQWFARRTGTCDRGERTVLLLADTYTNFLQPQIGRAAVRVLEAAGFKLRLAPIECCGRPLISKGFAIEARAVMRRNLDALAPLMAEGTPLVGLEPSCLLSFRDESLSLCPGPEAERVAAGSFLLGEFLLRDTAGRELLQRCCLDARALFHGHCQHKALARDGSPAAALQALDGLTLEELDAGCCGMAGAFGYEQEHYELSLAMGERVLLPAVRAAAPSTLVVADGFSCRCQIEHATERRARHSGELLAEALDA
jgi:Fe-S oxidoreductase